MSECMFLGVDIGTEGTRASIYDSTGKLCAKADHPLTTFRPKYNWIEHDAREWWRSAFHAIKECMGKVPSPNAVKAVSVCGTSGTIVPVGDHGEPLRPAILYSDTRATEQAEELSRDDEIRELGRTQSSKMDASGGLAKILWILRNEPEVFRRTHKFLATTDYVVLRLSGLVSCDYFNAAKTSLNLVTKQWPRGTLERFEIPFRMLPDLKEPGTHIGEVTGTAAKETGLKEGTTVVAGATDGIAGFIASGAVEPGQACEVTGTTQVFHVTTDKLTTDPLGRIYYHVHPKRGYWIAGGASSGGGIILRWLHDMLLPDTPFEKLDDEAERVEPLSGGLLCEAAMTGERTPRWDPHVSGMLIGLTPRTTSAHIYRSMMEGVAFLLKAIVNVCSGLGIPVKEIRSAGGGAKSRIWRQIKADVLGQPIIVPEDPSSTLGVAMLASIGAGTHRDIFEAAKNMVRISDVTKPDLSRTRTYEEGFKICRSCYAALKEAGIYEKLAEIRARANKT
nr:FGGY family carbohydrate kinase [Candidatus Njordarchaeum guaymaensis]